MCVFVCVCVFVCEGGSSMNTIYCVPLHCIVAGNNPTVDLTFSQHPQWRSFIGCSIHHSWMVPTHPNEGGSPPYIMMYGDVLQM